MRLGKATTYAVFAVLYIAQQKKSKPVQGHEIARNYGIPLEYLLKILQQLVKAQVLISERGRTGGFQMRKSASQTAVLDIVEAVEGPITGEISARREITGASRAKKIVEGLCRDSAGFTRSLLKKVTVQKLIG